MAENWYVFVSIVVPSLFTIGIIWDLTRSHSKLRNTRLYGPRHRDVSLAIYGSLSKPGEEIVPEIRTLGGELSNPKCDPASQIVGMTIEGNFPEGKEPPQVNARDLKRRLRTLGRRLGGAHKAKLYEALGELSDALLPSVEGGRSSYAGDKKRFLRDIDRCATALEVPNPDEARALLSKWEENRWPISLDLLPFAVFLKEIIEPSYRYSYEVTDRESIKKWCSRISKLAREAEQILEADRPDFDALMGVLDSYVTSSEREVYEKIRWN